MKKKIAYIIIIAFIGISLALYTQPGSIGGWDDEPQDVPVDGRISLLTLAGAVYGFRKIKKITVIFNFLKPKFKKLRFFYALKFYF
jgi:hypothetical protein